MFISMCDLECTCTHLEISHVEGCPTICQLHTPFINLTYATAPDVKYSVQVFAKEFCSVDYLGVAYISPSVLR